MEKLSWYSSVVCSQQCEGGVGCPAVAVCTVDTYIHTYVHMLYCGVEEKEHMYVRIYIYTVRMYISVYILYCKYVCMYVCTSVMCTLCTAWSVLHSVHTDVHAE